MLSGLSLKVSNISSSEHCAWVLQILLWAGFITHRSVRSPSFYRPQRQQNFWTSTRFQSISIWRIGDRKPLYFLLERFFPILLCRIYYDKNPPGWLVWNDTVSLYTLPQTSRSTFQPWEQASADAVQAVREVTTDPEYWENMSMYYSEENHETTIIQDNVSFVKSICKHNLLYFFLVHRSLALVQLLEDEPFKAFKPTVEKLIADKDHNKQRAAAEFLAGVLGG